MKLADIGSVNIVPFMFSIFIITYFESSISTLLFDKVCLEEIGTPCIFYVYTLNN